jgi:hypothetical protein
MSTLTTNTQPERPTSATALAVTDRRIPTTRIDAHFLVRQVVSLLGMSHAAGLISVIPQALAVNIR